MCGMLIIGVVPAGSPSWACSSSACFSRSFVNTCKEKQRRFFSSSLNNCFGKSSYALYGVYIHRFWIQQCFANGDVHTRTWWMARPKQSSIFSGMSLSSRARPGSAVEICLFRSKSLKSTKMLPFLSISSCWERKKKVSLQPHPYTFHGKMSADYIWAIPCHKDRFAKWSIFQTPLSSQHKVKIQ